MKFKIAATIPVASFGNLQPELEVEADSYDDAYALAMPKIEAIWSRYCEPGRELRAAPDTASRQYIPAFVGGSVWYDAASHTYSNEAGDAYLSGSAYAHQFEKPFDRDKITAAMGKKFGVSPATIQAMWELKAGISRGIGTALHEAIQLYGQYNGLAEAMDKTTALHDNPMVKQAVELFFAKRGKETAQYEAVIVDHATRRAGRVDRLVISEATKSCVIEDFKSDTVIDKKLAVYSKQLNFYRAIMEAGGWTVLAMAIYHWDGVQWTTYPITKESV